MYWKNTKIYILIIFSLLLILWLLFSYREFWRYYIGVAITTAFVVFISQIKNRELVYLNSKEAGICGNCYQSFGHKVDCPLSITYKKHRDEMVTTKSVTAPVVQVTPVYRENFENFFRKK
jgi:hypothetical protein